MNNNADYLTLILDEIMTAIHKANKVAVFDNFGNPPHPNTKHTIRIRNSTKAPYSNIIRINALPIGIHIYAQELPDTDKLFRYEDQDSIDNAINHTLSLL